MTVCTTKQIELPPFRRRKVVADFAGGDTFSNGGVMFLELAERGLGLLRSVARGYRTPAPGKVLHGIEKLLRQRVRWR